MQTRNKANVVVALLTFALAAHAQTSRGTVLDRFGATVAGARVSLIGVDTGVMLSSESNDAGLYRFDAVDLGVYQLQVAQPGSRTYLGSGINVGANRVTIFDPLSLARTLPGANGGRGQLGHERLGKHGRPILD